MSLRSEGYRLTSFLRSAHIPPQGLRLCLSGSTAKSFLLSCSLTLLSETRQYSSKVYQRYSSWSMWKISCPGCSWLACFALPFYLVVSAYSDSNQEQFKGKELKIIAVGPRQNSFCGALASIEGLIKNQNGLTHKPEWSNDLPYLILGQTTLVLSPSTY